MSLTHYTPPGGPGFLLPLCGAEHHPLAGEYMSTDPARVTCAACLLAIQRFGPVDVHVATIPAPGGAA